MLPNRRDDPKNFLAIVEYGKETGASLQPQSSDLVYFEWNFPKL